MHLTPSTRRQSSVKPRRCHRQTWRTRETCRARSMNANGVSGMKFAPVFFLFSFSRGGGGAASTASSRYGPSRTPSTRRPKRHRRDSKPSDAGDAPGRFGKALTESRLTARRCILEGCCSGVGVDDRGLRRTKAGARARVAPVAEARVPRTVPLFFRCQRCVPARLSCVWAPRGFLPLSPREGARFAAGFARRGCGLPCLGFREFRVRIQRFAAGCMSNRLIPGQMRILGFCD